MTVKNSVLVHRGALLPPYTLKHNITRKMYARVLKGVAFAPWSDNRLVLEELQDAADSGLSADVCFRRKAAIGWHYTRGRALTPRAFINETDVC